MKNYSLNMRLNCNFLKFGLLPQGTKNGLLALLGDGAPRVLMLLGTLFSARLLGSSAYGQYGVLWAKIQVAWVVIEFGTGMAGTRDLSSAMEAGRKAEVISGVFSLRMLLWLCVLLFLPMVMAIDPEMYLIVAIYLLAQALIPDWMLRAAERFDLIGKAQFLSAIVYVALVIPAVWHYRSIQALLWAHAIQSIVVCFFLWVTLPESLRRRNFVRPTRSMLWQFIRRGGFFALTGGLVQAGVAGILSGTGHIFGAAAAGVVAVLMRIYQLVNAASFMLAVGYFPRLARDNSVGEKSALRRLMWVSGLIFAILFMLAVSLAGLFLGASYSSMNIMACWAVLGLLLAAVRYGYSISLTATKNHWETVIANATYFLIALSMPYLVARWLNVDWIGLSISFAEAGALLAILLASKFMVRKVA